MYNHNKIQGGIFYAEDISNRGYEFYTMRNLVAEAKGKRVSQGTCVAGQRTALCSHCDYAVYCLAADGCRGPEIDTVRARRK